MEPLILASQSPRRRELLSLYGVPFVVEPSRADESQISGAGRERVMRLAQRHPGRVVLAADTLVCVDQDILGKPKDAGDAAAMLGKLSGRDHQVYTGVCLRLPDGSEKCDVEETTVTFMPLSHQMIQRYIATGEPFDKAGAYAIQGTAGIFITGIHGSPSNVIGLPLDLLTRLFMEAGINFLQA